MGKKVLLRFITLIIAIGRYHSTNLLKIWGIASKLGILVTFCNEKTLEV